MCAVAEEVGNHLLPEPFIAAGVQIAALLREVPQTDLQARLLKALGDGELIAALAWQEELGQLDAGTPTTQVEVDQKHILLSGRKLFVAAAKADGWIVSASAAAGTGIELYWVPKDTQGVNVENHARADGGMMATLVLDRARLGRENRLASGDLARRALDAANDIARMAQSAELLGVARRALWLALEYARTRVQFGRPIGTFQSLQHRLVDAYIQTELCDACIAAALADIETSPEKLATLASRVKARSTHAALLTTRLAIQIHGAMGFTDDCDVGLYFKRALTLNAWLGNTTQHRRRHFLAQRAACAAWPLNTCPTTSPGCEFPSGTGGT